METLSQPETLRARNVRRLLYLRWRATISFAFITLILNPPTYAATETNYIYAGTAVANNCTISTSPIAFGSYDPVSSHASAPRDGTGSVTITCVKGTSPTIGLGLGSNATGSTRRLVAVGPKYLTYELYQDSGYTTIWNATTQLLSPSAAPSKSPRSFTVYGRIPQAQDVSAGNYSDTVLATVNF